jgi:ubiquinone/menaquinone biosynthesis C-methylase UbiE
MDAQDVTTSLAAHHNAYAADYDVQIEAYGCYLAEVLFGLAYDYIQPGHQLLDLGIGSGLSAALFAKAGLNVSGMDFSVAMLDICRAKGIAVELREQDLLQTPWPYPSSKFDHAVCCGVFHFIDKLETIFDETDRVLKPGGMFTFTSKAASIPVEESQAFTRSRNGELDIFCHSLTYLNEQLDRHNFARKKLMRCFVADDIFYAWVVQKSIGEER